jgi:outer membrane protein assembly factor BamB
MWQNSEKVPFIALLAVLVHAAAPTLAADWPQWRGPNRDGQFIGPAWPDQLAALEPAWRVELAPSYSGPVVVGSRVFTTETKDRQTEIVRALDRTTGRELWRAEWPGALSVPFFAKANGDWIRATPACDGESLFVAGMRDVLVCLDAATGSNRWRRDFVKELQTPLPDFGFVSSPLVAGDAVYVQAGAAVLKLDKRTGELRWRALTDSGGMWGSAFSSPILARLAGREQVVVQTRQLLAGLDPATGEVLWSQAVEAFRGMNILTPVVFGDAVFTSTYGGRTILFAVTQTNGQFRVTPAWNHKAQGNMTTPVIVDGHAYHLLRNQRALCLDLRTGDERWLTEETFGKYWSLAAQGNRILALDQRGWLYLLRATPERFTQLDARRLTEAETWAHLAVTEEGLFVRELNALVAWRWTTQTSAKSN